MKIAEETCENIYILRTGHRFFSLSCMTVTLRQKCSEIWEVPTTLLRGSEIRALIFKTIICVGGRKKDKVFSGTVFD